jgi:hypothetical protein
MTMQIVRRARDYVEKDRTGGDAGRMTSPVVGTKPTIQESDSARKS